jgi:hypothetical protein
VVSPGEESDVCSSNMGCASVAFEQLFKLKKGWKCKVLALETTPYR